MLQLIDAGREDCPFKNRTDTKTTSWVLHSYHSKSYIFEQRFGQDDLHLRTFNVDKY